MHRHRRNVFKICRFFILFQAQSSTVLHISENEKACVEKNVSTPGISIYFEAYLYSSGNYSSSSWQLPASSLLAPQRRPSMGEEEDEHDSPVEGQPEKVKKPKKVYCYISPKVNSHLIGVLFFSWMEQKHVLFFHQIATICKRVLPENYSMAPFHLSSVSRNKGELHMLKTQPRVGFKTHGVTPCSFLSSPIVVLTQFTST